jgi:hypothetical protein
MTRPTASSHAVVPRPRSELSDAFSSPPLADEGTFPSADKTVPAATTQAATEKVHRLDSSPKGLIAASR